MISTFREPIRVELDFANWEHWSEEEKAQYYRTCDSEIDEVGVVILAGAISPALCDSLAELIDKELKHLCNIERKMNERRLTHKGYTLYDLQQRHPMFMDLITFPPVVRYFRRYLGERMVLHSSQARITPQGTGDGHWHYDGYDRIKDYFLSMNSLYYLCDSTRENGATRYVPGTHKEFLSVVEAAGREFRYLDVKKGDVVMFNPYLIHSGSANHTPEDRPIIINYYQRGYIKQEFDYYHKMSYLERRKLTSDQRVLLGFNDYSAADIHELYVISKGDNRLSDMNPYA